MEYGPLYRTFERFLAWKSPAGNDAFSWYGGDFTTDAALADDTDATPQQRANPSMASWGNDGYLDQQRRRLPSHKFRRLHLNLPGAPDGAAFDGDRVMSAIVMGRKSLVREPGQRYGAFVDMSGGSNEEAVLAISHADGRRKIAVLDVIIIQTGKPPFNRATPSTRRQEVCGRAQRVGHLDC